MKNVDKNHLGLSKKLLDIAKILGQPIEVDIQVHKGVIDILKIDKLEETGDYDDSEPAININKKIKISDSMRYIG